MIACSKIGCYKCIGRLLSIQDDYLGLVASVYQLVNTMLLELGICRLAGSRGKFSTYELPSGRTFTTSLARCACLASGPVMCALCCPCRID